MLISSIILKTLMPLKAIPCKPKIKSLDIHAIILFKYAHFFSIKSRRSCIMIHNNILI